MEQLEAAYLQLVHRRDLPRPVRTVLVFVAVLIRELQRDAVMVRAATLSFWTLLAMVPVLVLTAVGDEDQEVRVFESGGNDFLSKPFRPRALSARLKSLIRAK